MVKKNDRNPVAAGKFYPADSHILKEELTQFMQNTSSVELQNTRAIICPHAGYVFSGQTAAYSFSQIPSDATYTTIFLLASSHYVNFNGASIFNTGNYITPLGKVFVDKSLASKLINENDVFSFQKDAHSNEHSIEVQLPFLQDHLKQPFKIVPIVIGTNSPETCKKIAQALSPYFKKENLFIISTDFSHYPTYDDATKNDLETADAILANNSYLFLQQLKKNKQKGISQLQTSICGWTSVLTLLHMTENNKNITYNKLHYTNSGDNSLYGDKTCVVGYWAISAIEKSNDFSLTTNEKAALLKLVRQTLENHFSGIKSEAELPQSIANLNCGAFVTLHLNKKLRGCIGRLQSNLPLQKLIPELALSAALNDGRFTPVKAEELNKIHIEISLLSPMEKINNLNDIELGKHGIYIRQGFLSGTLLPQVATETGWSKEEFVSHCSEHKAGIGKNGWKDAELYRYQALVFEESPN